MSGEAPRVSAVSHAGAVRPENQDALLCRPEVGLYVVADGAGGHRDGALASNRVVASVASLAAGLSAAERLTHLRHRLSALHDALLEEAATLRPERGMASTVVALLLDQDFFACLWAGDSRIYLLREGELTQLTRDHSVVQELVDTGMIEAWEAESHPQAHVITRAIGAGRSPLVLDKRVGQLLPFDRFLLCSDGLSKTLADAEIKLLLQQGGDAAAQLVEAALLRKARDNVTAIVVETD